MEREEKKSGSGQRVKEERDQGKCRGEEENCMR